MTRHLPKAVFLPLAIAFLASPLRAEILEERLQGNLVPIQYGAGTTRLDGMGLSLAGRDENNEINLFDFGLNPAGLLSDRDAWSIDVRLAHHERAERNPALPGFEFRGNTYSLLAGYRNPGLQAVAGGFDYFDTVVDSRTDIQTQFKNTQYRFLFNRQISKIGLGLEFRYASETEDLINPRRIYFIEHNTDVFTGIVGLSYDVHPYVTVAGLGNLRRASVTGESAADDHLDVFDWSRPSGGAEAQIFVNHPRLHGAAIFGRTEGAGEEIGTFGWSPLFVYNPSPYFIRFEEQVFTEEHEKQEIRTRWELEILPDVASISAAWNDATTKGEIRTVPAVLGSRQPLKDQFDASDVAVGGSLYLFEQRLFLGGEVHHQEQTYTDIRIDGYARQLKLTSFNIGSEYLVFENFAARVGLGVRSEDRIDSRDPEETSGATGTKSATMASIGLGLVPSGGILQLDAAYSTDVSSGWNIDQSQFSLYARLLF
jgi:hypothetical protein